MLKECREGCRAIKADISTQLSSTPTFCGHGASSRYRGDSKPRIPANGSVVDGSSGSPKTQGMLDMWHRPV